MDIATWIYIFCLAFGIFFAFVSGFFGMIFGEIGFGDADAGGGGDIGTDVDAGGHMSPASAPIVSTLLTGFGGVGVICTQVFHLPPLLSLPISFVIAIGGAAVVFFALSKLMLSLQGTSHSTLASLVGTEAQVITPIPPDGVGDVAYSHGGVRESRPARAEEGVLIPQHSLVRITRVAGSTLMVRELVDERLRRLDQVEEEEGGESEK